MESGKTKEFLTKLAQEEEFQGEFLKIEKEIKEKRYSRAEKEKVLSDFLLTWSKKLGYSVTTKDLIYFGQHLKPNELKVLVSEDLKTVSGGLGIVKLLALVLATSTALNTSESPLNQMTVNNPNRGNYKPVIPYNPNYLNMTPDHFSSMSNLFTFENTNYISSSLNAETLDDTTTPQKLSEGNPPSEQPEFVVNQKGNLDALANNIENQQQPELNKKYVTEDKVVKSTENRHSDANLQKADQSTGTTGTTSDIEQNGDATPNANIINDNGSGVPPPTTGDKGDPVEPAGRVDESDTGVATEEVSHSPTKLPPNSAKREKTSDTTGRLDELDEKDLSWQKYLPPPETDPISDDLETQTSAGDRLEPPIRKIGSLIWKGIKLGSRLTAKACKTVGRLAAKIFKTHWLGKILVLSGAYKLISFVNKVATFSIKAVNELFQKDYTEIPANDLDLFQTYFYKSQSQNADDEETRAQLRLYFLKRRIGNFLWRKNVEKVKFTKLEVLKKYLHNSIYQANLKDNELKERQQLLNMDVFKGK